MAVPAKLNASSEVLDDCAYDIYDANLHVFERTMKSEYKDEKGHQHIRPDDLGEPALF